MQDGAPKIAFSCLISSGFIYGRHFTNELLTGSYFMLYKPTFTSLGGPSCGVIPLVIPLDTTGHHGHHGHHGRLATGEVPDLQCVLGPPGASIENKRHLLDTGHRWRFWWMTHHGNLWEMEWKWNGNGMEMEWKWNGNGMEMEWKWMVNVNLWEMNDIWS